MSRPNRREWSPEDILAAGLEWAETFEEPPASSEWGGGLTARIRRAEAKVSRLREKQRTHKAGAFPSTEAVRHHFGDWTTFIGHLGFTPNAQGEGRPTVERLERRRAEARALNELGPIHVRLLYIIKRGVLRIDVSELARQAGRQGLADTWPDRLDELLDSGLVERFASYRLTKAGEEALEASGLDRDLFDRERLQGWRVPDGEPRIGAVA